MILWSLGYMQKIYECLDYGVAEKVRDELNDAGVSAYIVDYSRRLPGVFGYSVSENPTVYIRESSQHAKAMKVVASTEERWFGKSKEQANKRIETKLSPNVKKIIVFIVTLLFMFLLGYLYI